MPETLRSSTTRRQALFWLDPYLFEFRTRIKALPAKNEVLLEQTAFYPGGGGQPADSGVLLLQSNPRVSFRVVAVEKKGDEISHTLKGKASSLQHLSVGIEVIGRIDKKRRLNLMAAHTSQHILSAMIKKIAGIETEKVHIDESIVTVFLQESLPKEVLRKAVTETNAFLLSGKKVQTHFYSKNALPKTVAQSLRGNLTKIPQQTVRVVLVEGLDASLCAGTHVKNTKEIGILVLTDFHGKIIHYTFGTQALSLLATLNVDTISIAKRLAAKPEENEKRIAAILEEYQLLKQLNTTLAKQLAKYQIPELKKKPFVIGPFTLLVGNFEHLERKFVLQQLGPLEKNTIVLLIVKGPLLVLLSNVKDLAANELLALYCKQTKVKGGGSQTIAQAAIPESETTTALALAQELILKVLKDNPSSKTAGAASENTPQV